MSYTPFLELRSHQIGLQQVHHEAMSCSGLDEARRLIQQVRLIRYRRALEVMEQVSTQQNGQISNDAADLSLNEIETKTFQRAEVIPMPVPTPSEPEPIAA